MAVLCVQCGKPVQAGASFCASCGTPAPAGPPPSAALPVPRPVSVANTAKVVASPRSGGAKGLLIALGSLGCLAVIVVGVLVLGVVLHTVGQSNAPRPSGSPAREGPAYNQSLERLLPKESGGYTLQKIQTLDSETVTMYGAAEALRGRYTSGMSLLVLNYTSADRAGRGVGPLRSLLFPEKEGWNVVQEGAAKVGYRVAVLQDSSGKLATIWNYGSIVLIFWGDGSQVPQFEQCAPGLLSNGES